MHSTQVNWQLQHHLEFSDPGRLRTLDLQHSLIILHFFLSGQFVNLAPKPHHVRSVAKLKTTTGRPRADRMNAQAAQATIGTSLSSLIRGGYIKSVRPPKCSSPQSSPVDFPPALDQLAIATF